MPRSLLRNLEVKWSALTAMGMTSVSKYLFAFEAENSLSFLIDRPSYKNTSNSETTWCQCRICFIFGSQSSEALQSHIKKQHDPTLLVCEYPRCRALIYGQTTLDDHYDSFHELRIFVCPVNECHVRHLERNETRESRPSINSRSRRFKAWDSNPPL